ncbi:unnamed protein product [Pedinophyceae sp. YPF-701]|nr:unnamed protein product [Pedinophyceae sp. YPF-701]
MLRTTTALQRLDISADRVWDSPEASKEGMFSVLAALGDNKTVEVAHFTVSHHLLDDPSVIRAFAALLRSNTALKELRLNRSDSEEDGLNDVMVDDPVGRGAAVQEFYEALGANTSLETLKLDPSDWGINGETFGTSMARNRTLRHLQVWCWDVSVEGARKMGRGLAKVRSFRSLTICLDNEGQVLALLDGLWKNKACRSQMQRLHIGAESKLSCKVAQKLADVLALDQCTLQYLHVRDNAFGVAGARALSEALRTNTSLVSLAVEWSGLTKDGVMALLDALQDNTTLRRLVLGSIWEKHELSTSMKEAVERVHAHVLV